MLARLKHFGWGREGEGLTLSEEAYVLGRIEQRFGWSADGEVKPPRLEDIKLDPPRSIRPHRCHSARRGTMTARRTLTANLFPIMHGGSSATIGARRTSSRIRATRKRSRRCLTGRAARRRA